MNPAPSTRTQPLSAHNASPPGSPLGQSASAQPCGIPSHRTQKPPDSRAKANQAHSASLTAGHLPQPRHSTRSPHGAKTASQCHTTPPAIPIEARIPSMPEDRKATRDQHSAAIPAPDRPFHHYATTSPGWPQTRPTRTRWPGEQDRAPPVVPRRDGYPEGQSHEGLLGRACHAPPSMPRPSLHDRHSAAPLHRPTPGPRTKPSDYPTQGLPTHRDSKTGTRRTQHEEGPSTSEQVPQRPAPTSRTRADHPPHGIYLC